MIKEYDRDILLTYAKNNMSIEKTAKATNYNRNTITYHLNKVKKTTGKDPRNLFDLNDLLGIAVSVTCDECIYRKSVIPNDNGVEICPRSGMLITLHGYCNFGKKVTE